MLKQTIDAYNFLLDIVDFFKQPSLRIKSLVFSVAALLGVAGSLLSVQAMSGGSASEQNRQADNSQALSLQQNTSKGEAQADKSDTASVPAGNATKEANTVERKGNEPAERKVAGRTEESAASKSFRLPITKNNQYEPGTLIAYDALKDDRAYYAGNLMFDRDTITISKSGSAVAVVNIKTSDSADSSVPAEPTEDNSSYFTVSLDAGQANEAKNDYNMIVELNGQVEPGVYQLHLTAGRSGQAAGMWWYHGFVAVNVVE